MGLYRSKTLSKAKKTADRWFSRYIRLRDSDSNGVCRCVTCNEPNHWKECDAGHFQSRRYLLTRYHEKNCHAQCVSCNKWNSGEQYKHGLEIDNLYGKGTAQELEKKARGLSQLKKHDVMEIAREYKEMAEELADQKGIDL